MASRLLTKEIEDAVQVVRPGDIPPLPEPDITPESAMAAVSGDIMGARQKVARSVNGYDPTIANAILAPQDDHLTPQGVPAPSEIQAATSGVNSILKALQTPGVGSLLAQFGLAIAGPDSFAGRLAPVVQKVTQGQIQQNIIKAAESGEKAPGLGASSTFGATPETIAGAEQILQGRKRTALNERDVARAEKATDAEIAQGEETLRLKGIDLSLEQDRINLTKDRNEWEKLLEDRKARVDEIVGASLARLHDAQALLQNNQAEATGGISRRALDISRITSARSTAYQDMLQLQQVVQNATIQATAPRNKDIGESEAQAATRRAYYSKVLTDLKPRLEDLKASLKGLDQEVSNYLQNSAVGGTPTGNSKKPKGMSQAEFDALPRPKTMLEFNAIKPGDLYIDLEGNPRVKTPSVNPVVSPPTTGAGQLDSLIHRNSGPAR